MPNVKDDDHVSQNTLRLLEVSNELDTIFDRKKKLKEKAKRISTPKSKPENKSTLKSFFTGTNVSREVAKIKNKAQGN